MCSIPTGGFDSLDRFYRGGFKPTGANYYRKLALDGESLGSNSDTVRQV